MLKKIVLLIFLISSIYGETLQIDTIKNYPQAIQLSKKLKKPIILFVYSNYCPWCDRMKRDTLQNKEVIRFINKNFIFVQEKQRSKTLPKVYQSDFIPMTYILNYEDQELLSEIPGFKKADLYIELLEDNLFDE